MDLPGYGYAQAPDAIRRHWRTLVERYLRERTALRGLLLLMDIRHPLTAAGPPTAGLLRRSRAARPHSVDQGRQAAVGGAAQTVLQQAAAAAADRLSAGQPPNCSRR
ncbi:MAG: hypothetical protein MZV65_20200 [Chromatiales bacterium]|nr:hypothetical protein [Chromatiales bacterium]